MGYVSVTTKLASLLNEITDFQAVYQYEPNALSGYPAAIVIAVGHRDAFYDTAANRRTYSYLIKLLYRLDVDADAESILQQLTDQVIAKLEANVTVAGVWEIARPTQATWSFGEREVPVRVVELTVDIESRVLR